MGIGNAPVSCWFPCFGVDAGGAFVCVAKDPQGAFFALVGPK